MVVEVRRMHPEEPPPLRVVSTPSDPVADDPIGEEFGFPTNKKAIRAPRPPRVRRRGRLVPLVLILFLAAAALFVVRTLGADDESEPVPTVSAAPSPSVAPAPAQPVGVPMSIVSSRIVQASAQTYRASVVIRNPTDVPAADVTITLTLKDAGGRVLKTDTRMLDVLPSGRPATVEFGGELDTGAGTPAALDVQATASRLIAPSV